ncbi:MAG: hypothetical protein LUQ28_14675 [Methylococcaceae bacterium]|nr:hypothetical protein [Methylococcaceae bacterium]
MAKNDLPTLLSFTRSIVPSNGVFYYLKDEKKYPITFKPSTSAIYRQTSTATTSILASAS